MLALAGVAKAYRLPNGDPLPILELVDLEVRRGESVAIVGRSGSGKSTLLNVLGLLDRPDAGTYRVDGQDTLRLGDREAAHLRGRRFGFVFQQFYLLEGRTALANVAAPLQHASVREYRLERDRPRALLQRVGLGDRTEALPSQLSGGEQQRVAIARSLVRRPAFLLADEPTGSLDAETATSVLELLFGLVREESTGLVFVTHDRVLAERADRQLLVAGGRLEAVA